MLHRLLLLLLLLAAPGCVVVVQRDAPAPLTPAVEPRCCCPAPVAADHVLDAELERALRAAYPAPAPPPVPAPRPAPPPPAPARPPRWLEQVAMLLAIVVLAVACVVVPWLLRRLRPR